MTNRERAEKARVALKSLSYWGQNDSETDLGDFLCDLQHLCRMEGWDFDLALERSAYHYREERLLDWDEEE